jgi:glutamine amidotransferase
MAMRRLEESGLRAALEAAVRGRGVPVLGICLGMQLLARHSEEGDARGLGWLDADVVRFRVGDTLRFKVPHMGWNGMRALRAHRLTDGLPPDPEFYFVHSYHLVCRDPGDVLGETTYDSPFPSAVARDNVLGVQFHPEKSHGAGRALLAGFLAV